MTDTRARVLAVCAAGEVCRAGGAGAEAVIADARQDQLFHRASVNLAGHHGDDHRVAREARRQTGRSSAATTAGRSCRPVMHSCVTLRDCLSVSLSRRGTRIYVQARADRSLDPNGRDRTIWLTYRSRLCKQTTRSTYRFVSGP